MIKHNRTTVAALGTIALLGGYLFFVLGGVEWLSQSAEIGSDRSVDRSGAWLRFAAGFVATGLGAAILWLSATRVSLGQAAQSSMAGLPAHPRLGGYVEFHFATLAAYGFGIAISEIVFIVTYLATVAKGTAITRDVGAGLSTTLAFVAALGLSMLVAFIGGFLGASNSKRLSIPEVTVGLLYFGLPIPIGLSALHHFPSLMFDVGHKLREVMYLSSLLGDARPEMGYWLVFLALALTLFLGMNAGFVSTASGRFDLQFSFEQFVATRHVSVFRPRLLIGTFVTLLFGIVPPLLLWAIIRAVASVVERSRIKRASRIDPLVAAAQLDALKRQAQTPTAMMTALSVGAVGLGVMALIIVLSVMSGFESDLKEKILGTNAHGEVLKYGPSMDDYEEVRQKTLDVPGVIGATPFILNQVLLSSGGDIAGAMIKGIDPQTVGTVTDLASYLGKNERLEWLSFPKQIERASSRLNDDVPIDDQNPTRDDIANDPLIGLPKEDANEADLPAIIIGRELAARLRVLVGDRMSVVSPVGAEMGPSGPMAKVRPFRVAGIFYSGMYDYDSNFVYVHLREAKSLFALSGAMGIEVKVDDVDSARSIMKSVVDRLGGYPYRTKDWGEMNRNLFAALRLEKLVMAIILSIIVIVAAGLIVATVIMLVLEKRKEIAVLKALGVPDAGIVKIFLGEGLQIGAAGGFIGLCVGLLLCLFLERVGIKLDPQVYYIPALPVKIELFQTALAVLIAILVTFLASIYPALKASQVEPVDGLKSE